MNENFDLKNKVKLFMVFDILGDIIRTGPQLWYVKRERLEDVKDHILDLILIARILKKYFPKNIDFDKLIDYIICHDLPEAITGDITKFEGISNEEKQRVTSIAIEYLVSKFSSVLDFSSILNNYENRNDLEAKIVHIIDKVHSATTFIKYQSESNIDVNNPNIIPELRYLPFVNERINEGKDVADIFFEFHMREVKITDEECQKYNITRSDADIIVNAIAAFATELYNQKLNGTLLALKDDFPSSAKIYNRKFTN